MIRPDHTYLAGVRRFLPVTGGRRAARNRVGLALAVAGMVAGTSAVTTSATVANAAVGATTPTSDGVQSARAGAGRVATLTKGATRTVVYRGLRLTVPATWAVHDLDRDPRTCVRFDRPALYLGRPGADQRCPARAVGRTEAVLVQPAASAPWAKAKAPASLGRGAEVRRLRPGRTTSVTAGATADQEAHFDLTGTGLVATMAYGDRPALVEAILADATYTGPKRAGGGTALSGPAGTTGLSDPPSMPAGSTTTRFRGLGFDTCGAPSATTMRAWLASPYRSVGIYIGGVNRACPDGNLSAGWVRTVAGMGWKLTPIYVGRQAPCALQGDLGPIRTTNPGGQGVAAAEDAIADARRFGLAPGSTIYNDMEGYDTRSASCRRIVLAFLNGWTKRLHDGGYLSGVYSSASSGIRDLSGVYVSNTFARPDVIWTARWDGKPTVWGEQYVADSKWAMHQRIKQYRGPHTESWGGRRIEIDSDRVDSLQGSAKFVHEVISSGDLVTRKGPGTAYPAVGRRESGSNVNVLCQTAGSQVGATTVWDRLADGTYVSDLYVGTPNKRGYSAPIPKCRYSYTVWTDALRVRSGPGTNYSQVGQILYGGMANILCQRTGTQVGKSRVWDKLDNGGWVSDWYTMTTGRPGYTATIPRCP
ncbi:glycoside hydrolase domain-containing protein [Actinopolymorpha sp. NPDC004070]|uniref:glycoside hydrolase domain-containing protein n=1 Tax=Actinopolymorpha sp. NPDC004070 TaxID=3154548 RepID=UPI0033BE8AB7